MSETIRLTGVSKSFGQVPAVRDASLTAGRGEFVALLGPSGCGKTTLLRLIAGLEAPDTGEIEVEGSLVAGRRAWVPPERRNVGIVFQDYALFPHRTVAQNVGYGVERSGRARRVAAVLGLVGLAGYEQRYPHELSGGQQQRVALARALGPEPGTILLDEPWSNIDPLLRQAMREELAEILRRAGVTVLLVTHDREEAFSLSDRIALMHDGAVVQAGSAEDVYLRPADRWTAEFAGAANFVPGRLAGDRVDTPIGSFAVTPNGHGEAVEVLIRPERLELLPDAQGSGEVVDRQFRGHDVFYRVRLGDGTTLVSQRPSTEIVRLGERVLLRAHGDEVTVFGAP
ncbi:MAG: ABC transporter ATP-binding protein [Thermoleophilia bacterium]|nr:ABC transporter ATP-binding protein [Thermoleophilia bacterium]